MHYLERNAMAAKLTILLIVVAATTACERVTRPDEATTSAPVDTISVNDQARTSYPNGEGLAEATPARAEGVTCVLGSNPARAVVTRIADGFPLGGPGPRADCFTAVNAAKEGVVCTNSGGSTYGIFRIGTGSPIGRLGIMSIAECATATAAAADGAVCAKARADRDVFNKVQIETNAVLSSGFTLAECTSF